MFYIFCRIKLHKCYRKNESIVNNTKLIAAFIIYLQSSKVHELIRTKNILILPHSKTLLKLSSYQNVDPSNPTSSMKYLSKIVKNLTKIEKYVVLQIDEIYCKPEIRFRATHSLQNLNKNLSQSIYYVTILLYFLFDILAFWK